MARRGHYTERRWYSGRATAPASKEMRGVRSGVLSDNNRADAKYCSHKYQLRGNRRGLAFRGLSENISGNAGPQAIAA
jgi:hypothetical protein